MLDIDCDIVAGDWPDDTDWVEISETAVQAAFAGTEYAALSRSPAVHVEVSIRLTDDSEVQRLNLDYRGKDKPTNILSFPMLDEEAIHRLSSTAEEDVLLGDMAVAWETLHGEAAEKQIAVSDHFMHLLIHGTLHLLGHDHMEDAEAVAMETLETEILARLGIADPYSPERS